jgi:hypothetical protein
MSTQPKQTLASRSPGSRKPLDAIDERVRRALRQRQHGRQRQRTSYSFDGISAAGHDAAPGSTGGPVLDPTNYNRIAQSGGAAGTYGTLAGAVDGVNTVYTVPDGEYESGSLLVFLRGLLRPQGDWSETDPSAGTFTFSAAPKTSDVILVMYRSPA